MLIPAFILAAINVQSLIAVLVAALVLFLIYWVAGKFIQGTPLQIIGVILGLIFLVFALQRLGLLSSIS